VSAVPAGICLRKLSLTTCASPPCDALSSPSSVSVGIGKFNDLLKGPTALSPYAKLSGHAAVPASADPASRAPRAMPAGRKSSSHCHRPGICLGAQVLAAQPVLGSFALRHCVSVPRGRLTCHPVQSCCSPPIRCRCRPYAWIAAPTARDQHRFVQPRLAQTRFVHPRDLPNCRQPR
jgi:hypothetical protein